MNKFLQFLLFFNSLSFYLISTDAHNRLQKISVVLYVSTDRLNIDEPDVILYF